MASDGSLLAKAYGGTCPEKLKDVKALQATCAAFAALRALSFKIGCQTLTFRSSP